MKKLINKIKRKLLVYCEGKDSSVHQQVMYRITAYFHSTGFNRTKVGITDISVERMLFSKDINIIITLDRPGILIGKKCKYISQLTTYLNCCFKGDVKISLVQSKLWKYEYVGHLE
jgi:ribosomal protein S3